MTIKNNIPYLFKNLYQKNQSDIIIGEISHKKIKNVSVGEYSSNIKSLALGMLKFGMSKNSNFIYFSNKSLNLHMIDFAAMSIGIITIPVNSNIKDNQLEYIISDSNVNSILILSKDQFDKVKNINLKGLTLKNIITLFSPNETQVKFCEKNNLNLITYRELLKTGSAENQLNPENYNIASNLVDQSDLATVVYQDFQSSLPKKVSISHFAFTTVLNNFYTSFKNSFNTIDKNLIALGPDSTTGRFSSFIHLKFFFQTIFSAGGKNYLNDSKIVKPTLSFLSSEILQELYDHFHKKTKQISKIEIQKNQWANKASNEYFEKIDGSLSPSGFQILKRNMAFSTVFTKYKERLGGNLKFLISIGPPLPAPTFSFFRNSNITVLEGFGLTETAGPCFINPARKQVLGSVGLPIGDVKVQFTKDQEILLQSKTLPNSFDDEDQVSTEMKGWYSTGLKGKLTSEGYIQINNAQSHSL